MKHRPSSAASSWADPWTPLPGPRLVRITDSDEVTGLPLRHAFAARAERMAGEPLAAMIVELDHFLRFRGSYGRAVADHVLAHLAHVLRDELGAWCLVARWSSDAFVIACPWADVSLALDLAERVRIAIEDELLTAADGLWLPSMTCSIGVADMRGRGTVEALLARADAARGTAIREGGNCVRV